MSFANGPRLLFDLASSGTPWRREELRFVTSDGDTIVCPNEPGARVPVYEIFVEDAYCLGELADTAVPNPVVLDLGGQVGCFSVAYARRNPGATIHVYEASPSTAARLIRNVDINNLSDRVIVHAEAVSDTAGTLQFLDNGRASALNGLTGTIGTPVTVPSVTFRDAVTAAGGAVDVVKLDTEGAEYAIVLGGEPADWAPVRQVVMEYHDVPGHSWAELEAFFGAAGLHGNRHERAGDRQGTVWLRRS